MTAIKISSGVCPSLLFSSHSLSQRIANAPFRLHSSSRSKLLKIQSLKLKTLFVFACTLKLILTSVVWFSSFLMALASTKNPVGMASVSLLVLALMSVLLWCQQSSHSSPWGRLLLCHLFCRNHCCNHCCWLCCWCSQWFWSYCSWFSSHICLNDSVDSVVSCLKPWQKTWIGLLTRASIE